MIRTRLLIVPVALAAAALGWTARSPAHALDGPEPAAALVDSPIAKMIGRWEGEAWYTVGPPGAPRRHVRMVETAEWRMNRNAIVIEGTGEVVDAATEQEKIGHNAIAVVRADPKTQALKFHAFKLNEPPVDSDLEVLEGGEMRWGFAPFPGAETRFTITLTDDEWVEIGEFRQGEGAWNQFMEMTLKRVAP
jgi:hypothetical protein